MFNLEIIEIVSKSMVTYEGLQRIDIEYRSSESTHLLLNIFSEGKEFIKEKDIAFSGGKGICTVYLPKIKEDINTLWQITKYDRKIICEKEVILKKPREWTIYTMISSHTDIGLHNSQYIQRYNSSRFIDMAAELVDKTEDRDENDRYRYTMEGTWFWNNYGMDKGNIVAKEIVDKYIKFGKIGICSGIAGNHTQTYGLEEMCRAAYEKSRLLNAWGIESETMSMIDNNGMSMALIQPYADSGYKNIIFAPNHWNPWPSTVWKADKRKPGYKWNTNAGGGGARMDIRYETDLPMVFYWEDENSNRLLVWGSAQYDHGGTAFGLFHDGGDDREAISYIEENTAETLTLLEQKYPFDVWLLACYGDDQQPSLYLTNIIKAWNEKWEWPKIRTLGNPDEPFNILREKYDDKITVLRGDITGGWYQHPLTVPELMSQKFEADRLLPTAEKWSTTAAMLDENYKYPATDFRRAWDYLLYNDEHSYGTSGYRGRRVYETWMQHRDWIDKALYTAESENEKALKFIASNIKSEEEKIVIFNCTSQERREFIKSDGKYVIAVIPPFGYKTVKKSEFMDCNISIEKTKKPPVIENRFYRIEFADNGSIKFIIDKELNRELLDLNNLYKANELIYTKDNHKTFTTPECAEFEIIKENESIAVIAKTKECNLKTDIVQKVTLLNYEKRIDIENSLYHVKDMVNKNRYYRYIYYAFPFAVENCRRYCHLNGAVAEYAKSVTGHGTDVYMAVNEWCCSENDDFGVALMMKDSQLTEFDHIHSDKTDYKNTGDGSQIFSYIANDWLQMHTPGGSHLDYVFRYSITSYKGGYKKAKVPEMAERYTNPVSLVEISKQDGMLNSNVYSFLKFNTDMRFVCMKYADDGEGIILRMYGEEDEGNPINSGYKLENSTVDERPTKAVKRKGFVTYRLGRDDIRLSIRAEEKEKQEEGIPALIGSVYTGLITKPMAACGEESGHLYLLWGANVEADFSHYKLYRSEKSGFDINEETFLTDVYPEEYRVGRYEDKGLKEHSSYYYRVCAVNKAGICGKMSDEFVGITKEE